MRCCRFLVLLSVVVALAACARQPARQHYAASPPAMSSDLDTMMYGAPATSYSRPATPYSRPATSYGQPATSYSQPATSYSQPATSYRAPPPGYAPPPSPSRTTRHPTKYVPVTAMPVDDGPYTLDTGDRLRIVVYGQEMLSNTYAVDAAGMVTLPLIGAVPARELTTAALAGSIKGRLSQGFIREPSVAVEVETYRPFFVLGEVTYPGQYPFVPHMTVENAIAIAGGFTPRAGKSSVTVTRRIQGTPMRFAMPLQYQLRPGDILTVSERWF